MRLPHRVCISDPVLIAQEFGNSVIHSLGYLAIAAGLLWLVRRAGGVSGEVRWFLGAFAVFISACGLHHATDGLTLFSASWYPVRAWLGHAEGVALSMVLLQGYRRRHLLRALVSPRSVDAALARLEAVERMAKERTR